MSDSCRHCHAKSIDGAAFCHHCGASLAAHSEPGDKEPGVVVKQSRRRRNPQREPSSGRKRRRRKMEPGKIRAAADERERQLWRGTFSGKGLVNYWLAVAVATVFLPIVAVTTHADEVAWQALLVVIGLAWGTIVAWLIYLKLNVHYVLTNQRLLHKSGILTRHTRRIEVIDIDDISFRQGIFERFLNVGTIEIISSDVTDPVFELVGIEHVQEVALMIDDARRAERVRRGLHIESV